ncbi:MAG TPA: hypothetical protein VF221_07725, partial [Chloroflexota bacterium]
AFPLLELLAFWRVFGTRAWPLLVWVGFVLFTVVYLGEHWITDALAGYVYAIAIWVAVTVVTRTSVTRPERAVDTEGVLAGAAEPARSFHRGDRLAGRSDLE